jgi:hypothetical protein
MSEFFQKLNTTDRRLEWIHKGSCGGAVTVGPSKPRNKVFDFGKKQPKLILKHCEKCGRNEVEPAEEKV